DVTIKKLSVCAETARFGIFCKGGGTLNLSKVLIYGDALPNIPTFALIFGSAASNSVVNITDSYIEGYYGIIIWGQNMTINIDETVIVSQEDSGAEDFGAIVLGNGGYQSAENTVVNITKSDIIATNEIGNESRAVINGTETGVVNIDDVSTVIGTTIYPVAFVVSGFREYYFESLQEAVDYAISKVAAVAVIRDVNISSSIDIKGKVTIEGCGHTLTSSDNDVFLIDTVNEVKIYDYKITGKTECWGISIVGQPAVLILDNVTVSVENGAAVYVGLTAGPAELYIDNSNLSAGGALAIYGAGTKAEVQNTSLTGTNTRPYTNPDGIGTIDIAASDVTVGVFGGSITAIGQDGKLPQSIVHVSAGFTNVHVYLATELILGGTAKTVRINPSFNPLIAVREQYKQQLNNEGYGVTPPDVDHMIYIDYSIEVFHVTYVADGNTVAEIRVQNGDDVATPPAVPPKSGYTGAWDHDGTNITADTTITAVYTKTPVPETGDNINIMMWAAMMMLSGLGMTTATVYYRKKRLN
ncbi:MAG TPA: hypothetical protein PLI19_04080, partial [Erysipelotrichaceae bacterium]|nr:hypothetical protein [Erysipelotrichaceae bacterium]